MMDWTSDLEDVACALADDDMKKMDSTCLRFWPSKLDSEGMEWGKGGQRFGVRVDGLSSHAGGRKD